jgi:hypothetical protein
VWSVLPSPLSGVESSHLEIPRCLPSPVLANAQELTLQSCYLVGLQALPPHLLQGMASLSSLALSNCELDTVPAFITCAPALSVLNLAGAVLQSPTKGSRASKSVLPHRLASCALLVAGATVRCDLVFLHMRLARHAYPGWVS